MLRLRSSIEGARRRRWVGLLVIVLLALLVVFSVVHDAEHALDEAAAACVALAVLFTTLVMSHGHVLRRRPLRVARERAPPTPGGATLIYDRLRTPVPLRR